MLEKVLYFGYFIYAYLCNFAFSNERIKFRSLIITIFSIEWFAYKYKIIWTFSKFQLKRNTTIFLSFTSSKREFLGLFGLDRLTKST